MTARTRTPVSIDRIFPHIVVGDRYEIGAGSRAGRLRISGTAEVESRHPTSAQISVSCRVLGVRSRGSIAVLVHDDGRVSITMEGLSVLSASATGAPRESGRNRLLLDLEPTGSFDAVCTERSLAVDVTGLRIGRLQLHLHPIEPAAPAE